MSISPTAAPVADWINPQELHVGPYPIYDRLRAESPVAYAPFMDIHFFSTFEGCRFIETSPQLFQADAGPASSMRGR